MITPERVKELREVIAKASDGPWELKDSRETTLLKSLHGPSFNVSFSKVIFDDEPLDTLSKREADGCLMASARNDLPSCLDTIEAQAARIVELEAALEKTRRTLLPFAGRVFNDNGDMTVDIGRFSHDEIVAAYWAERSTRAALTKGE